MPDTFCDLSNLERLDLYHCSSLTKLPKHIGKLRSLRFLYLSNYYYLSELPDTLCDFYNLEKLKIDKCVSLRKLPERMDKLVKFRYFDYTECHMIEGLPKVLGALDCLHRTNMFVVSRDREANLDVGDIKNYKVVKA